MISSARTATLTYVSPRLRACSKVIKSVCKQVSVDLSTARSLLIRPVLKLMMTAIKDNTQMIVQLSDSELDQTNVS